MEAAVATAGTPFCIHAHRNRQVVRQELHEGEPEARHGLPVTVNAPLLGDQRPGRQ
ncbi:hypothetical protein ABR737_22250 [Streptomyces sp. Edi2]|uniref:hypothetical protein n=1 Tax=Streptomyces sp. Edi2 TaxID=3162528 RepID=UPI0033067E24